MALSIEEQIEATTRDGRLSPIGAAESATSGFASLWQKVQSLSLSMDGQRQGEASRSLG
jgi:hypothetical protein